MASRTKAALAKNAADKELHGHLADVRRSLDRALDVCRRAARNRDQAELRGRAREQERKLRQMMAQVNALGYLAGPGGSDADLAPENGKVPPARARREAVNKQRQERRKTDRQLMKQMGWTP